MQYDNFSCDVRKVASSPSGKPFSGDAWVGIYYKMAVPQTLYGVTGDILNTQMLLFRDTDSPGGESKYEVGAGGVIKFKPPMTSWTGSVGVRAYFADRCRAIGLDPSGGITDFSVEVGVEGYRFYDLRADFANPVLS